MEDCPLCNQQFSTEEELTSHKNQSHSEFTEMYGQEDRGTDSILDKVSNLAGGETDDQDAEKPEDDLILPPKDKSKPWYGRVDLPAEENDEVETGWQDPDTGELTQKKPKKMSYIDPDNEYGKGYREDLYGKLDEVVKVAKYIKGKEIYAKETTDAEVLDFFSPPEEDDFAKCDICGEKYPGGDTEGMRQHLLNQHINTIKESRAKEIGSMDTPVTPQIDTPQPPQISTPQVPEQPTGATEETDDYEVDVDEYTKTGEPVQDIPKDKRATEEEVDDYSETCPECGKVFDNPADAGNHAVRHDNERYSEEGGAGSGPSGSALLPEQAARANTDYDPFKSTPKSQLMQTDPYVTRTTEEAPEEEKLKRLEEVWYKIPKETRAKIFESLGITQGDAYILAGLEYQYITEAVKKDIVKEAEDYFNEDEDKLEKYSRVNEEDEEEEELNEAYSFTYDLEKNHRSKDFKKKDLICTRCNESFYNSKDRNVHFNEVHMDANEYELPDQCPFCQEIIKEPETLDWHMQQDHGAHISSQYTQTGIQGAMADTDDFGIDQDFYNESKRKAKETVPSDDQVVQDWWQLISEAGGDGDYMSKAMVNGPDNSPNWESGDPIMWDEFSSSQQQALINAAGGIGGMIERLMSEGWSDYSDEDEDSYESISSIVNESRASDLKKEIKKLTNFINIASIENPMNMGDKEEELKRLKDELSSLGESRRKAKEDFSQFDHEDLFPTDPAGDEWREEGTLMKSNYDMSQQDMNRLYVDTMKESLTRAIQEGGANMNWSYWEDLLNWWSPHTGMFDLPGTKGDTPEAQQAFQQAHQEVKNWFRDQKQSVNATYPSPSWESKANEASVYGSFVDKYFEEEYVMDQDGMYKCKKCGGRMDIHNENIMKGFTPDEVARHHMQDEHNITESKANEDDDEQRDMINSINKHAAQGKSGLAGKWNKIPEPWEYGGADYRREGDPDGDKAEEDDGTTIANSGHRSTYSDYSLGKEDEPKDKKNRLDYADKMDQYIEILREEGDNIEPQEFYESKAKEDFDYDAAEPARIKLLLDQYKSGEDWVSDPKRLESEDGSFEGWLSYSKKFNVNDQDARKAWSGEVKATEQNPDKLNEDLMDEDGNPPDELGVDDAISYLTKMGVTEEEAKDAVKRFGGDID